MKSSIPVINCNCNVKRYWKIFNSKLNYTCISTGAPDVETLRKYNYYLQLFTRRNIKNLRSYRLSLTATCFTVSRRRKCCELRKGFSTRSQVVSVIRCFICAQPPTRSVYFELCAWTFLSSGFSALLLATLQCLLVASMTSHLSWLT